VTDHTRRPTPDAWVWRDEPVDGGPAVVFDMDGVLADAAARQHLLEGSGSGRRDWGAFFDAAGEDALIEEVARLTELLDPGLALVLLTARPVRIRDLTLAWLERHGLRWDLLVMRATRDFAASPDMKRVAVRHLQDAGFDLRLAFEDDRRNVEMFHAEGVPCIYIHSGYYEA
jgi:phosphoglycolate phosphatase-like HAD superfamily hydrolase